MKHYFRKTEHNFKDVESALGNTLSKELKRLFVNLLKEPLWIAKQWHELMACIITGSHLYVAPQAAEDIEKEQGIPGGLKESSSKDKGRESVTSHGVEACKRRQRFEQQTEDGDSFQKQAEYKADEEGYDHQEHKTTRTTPAPLCPLRNGS